MARFAIIFFICLALQITGLKAEAVTLIKYPKGATDGDVRTHIGLEAVKLALKATEKDFGPWRIDLFPVHMERKRRENSLEQGQKANVLMLPGKNEYDARFTLVPIPLDKGLLGYRVALISTKQKDVFKNITDKRQLANLRGCTLKPWNITKTFKHNKLKLAEFTRYEALFSAVEHQRCDYFSRSVGEIIQEFEHYKPEHPDLFIDPHLMLKTQLAEYLYVNKDHPALAKRLHEGLKRAYADGSFETFFKQQYGNYVAQLNLDNRRVIRLESAVYHSSEPDINSRYWYRN